jgi:hypothetical protein
LEIIMASLFDSFDDPNNAAMLQLASGLLAAGGPSRTPVNLGQAFGSAMPGALQARQAAMDQQRMQQARQAQMAEMQRKQAEEESRKAKLIAFRDSLPEQLRGEFDANPDEFVKSLYRQREESAKRQVVSPGQTVIEYGKPVYSADAKPEPPKLHSGGIVQDSTGFRIDPILAEAQRKQAAAGASQIRNEFNPGIKPGLEAFGKELPEKRTIAESSAKSILYINQIRDNLDKATIGAGADWKTKAQYVAQAFGLNVPTLADSQTVDNATSQLTAAIAKTFGANPSTYETQLLQVLAGNRTLEKGALINILDNAERDARDRIKSYNTSLGNFGDDRLNVFAVTPIPERQQAQADSAIPLPPNAKASSLVKGKKYAFMDKSGKRIVGTWDGMKFSD